MIRAADEKALATIIHYKIAMFKEAGHFHVLHDEAEVLIQALYTELYKENRAKHFIMEVNGVTAGCAGAFIKSDLPFCFYKVPYYGFIGDVYIKPEYRRNGCARQLTQEAMHWLKGKGVNMVRLLATPQAEGIYRQLGFEKTDEMAVWFQRSSHLKGEQ